MFPSHDQVELGDTNSANAGISETGIDTSTNWDLVLNSRGSGYLEINADTSTAGIQLIATSGVVDVQSVLQYDVSTLTVSSGAVTAVLSYHVINGEGASADTLDTISGGAQGDMVCLERGDADITLDCVSGAGNLSCPGAAADIVLNDNEVHCFIFNSNSEFVSVSHANP